MRMRLLLSLVATLATISPMRGENPFDFAGTPGKLPKHIVPEEYAIRITPDAKSSPSPARKRSGSRCGSRAAPLS